MKISTVVIGNVRVFSLGFEDSHGDMSESTLIVAVDWQWWLVLAAGPVFDRRFGSVPFVARPKTRTAMPWRVCYADRTKTLCFLAG